MITFIGGQIKNIQKTPTENYVSKKEEIIHLFMTCKRNKKTWKHFQKYYQKLTQKDPTPIQHILSQSTFSLPSKTRKLALTLTITILTHIWKTRNRVILTTNTIINIKNETNNT